MGKAFAVFLLMAFSAMWAYHRLAGMIIGSEIELGNHLMGWLSTFTSMFNAIAEAVSAIGDFISSMIEHIVNFFTWLFTFVQDAFCNIPFVC